MLISRARVEDLGMEFKLKKRMMSFETKLSKRDIKKEIKI